MYKKLAIIVLFLFFCNISFATVYYVDNVYGNNNNSGKSTGLAWKTIAKVNVFTFAPGDQILFKKGGKWYETLTIKSSGTSSSPITYGAYGSGNLPVIDGSMSRSNSIYLYSKKYVVFENLRLQNGIGSGQIRISHGTNITVRNCELYVTGHGGVFVQNSSNTLVLRNVITTPSSYYNKQTDGIYSQYNVNNIYDSNNILITNKHATHHIDGIQSFRDNGLTVRNNYIRQQNTKSSNAQGIYATTGSGIHTYYNNIVYCPNALSSSIGFLNLSSGTGTVRVYHNTVVGKGGSVLTVTEDANAVIKNNIFIATTHNSTIIRVSALNNRANLNHNLYYNNGGTWVASYNGSSKTLAQLKSLGAESNGIMANPKLESNYKLKTGSPAINKGIDLGSTFRWDRGGLLRPQKGIVDIGAYESVFYAKDESEEGITSVPEVFELAQNYPNPFNPSTQIRFSLPEASEVTLKIYDILGTEVATLLNEQKAAGTYTVQFNGSNLSSGVYVYQITTPLFNQTKKMMLVK